jgi:hypothetical protein
MAAVSPNRCRQQNQNLRKPKTTINPSSGPWGGLNLIDRRRISGHDAM